MVYGNNFHAAHISFENNTGFTSGQAVALRIEGNLASFKDYAVIGFQDLLFLSGSGLKGSYPCTEMVVSLYGKARILARKWSYPCTERVVSLHGKGRILVRKGSYPCTERIVSMQGKGYLLVRG